MQLGFQKVHPAKRIRSWLRVAHYHQAIECANVTLCVLVQWRTEETELSPGCGHRSGSAAPVDHDIGTLGGAPNWIGVNEIFLALHQPWRAETTTHERIHICHDEKRTFPCSFYFESYGPGAISEGRIFSRIARRNNLRYLTLKNRPRNFKTLCDFRLNTVARHHYR